MESSPVPQQLCIHEKVPLLSSEEYAKIIPDEMSAHVAAYTELISLDLEALLESEDENSLQKALAGCVKLMKELVSKSSKHAFSEVLGSPAELRQRIESFLCVLRVRASVRQGKRRPIIVNSQEFKKCRVASSLEECKQLVSEEMALHEVHLKQMREMYQKLGQGILEKDEAFQSCQAQLTEIDALLQKREESRAALKFVEEQCEAYASRWAQSSS
jgi:hypothetical protein